MNLIAFLALQLIDLVLSTYEHQSRFKMRSILNVGLHVKFGFSGFGLVEDWSGTLEKQYYLCNDY